MTAARRRTVTTNGRFSSPRRVVQIALAILLGWLVLTHRIQIWHVIVTRGAARRLHRIRNAGHLRASFPNSLGTSKSRTAVASGSLGFSRFAFDWTVAGGMVRGRWGAAAAFFCNALSFIALIIAIISIPPRKVGTAEEEEQRRSGIKEGFRYVTIGSHHDPR